MFDDVAIAQGLVIGNTMAHDMMIEVQMVWR